MPPVKRIQLVPAGRAEPRQERRFTAERTKFRDGLADRRLRDIAGCIPIEVEAHEREAIEDRIRGVEESFERGLVSGQHGLHEREVAFSRHKTATSRVMVDWSARAVRILRGPMIAQYRFRHRIALDELGEVMHPLSRADIE